MQRIYSGPADGAGSAHKGTDGIGRSYAIGKFAEASVIAHHGPKSHECSGLTGSLAVRGAVAVAVLCGKCDNLLIQKDINFFSVSGRVDAYEYNLTFTKLIVFGRLYLFYLGDEVAALPYLIVAGDYLSSGCCISLIIKAGLSACA